MTAFNTSLLPSGTFAITTVEELSDWCNAILVFNNPTDTCLEAINTNRIFRYMRPELRIPEGELIRVSRSMLGINEAAAQTLPSWKRIREFSVAQIPTGFRGTLT